MCSPGFLIEENKEFLVFTRVDWVFSVWTVNNRRVKLVINDKKERFVIQESVLNNKTG